MFDILTLDAIPPSAVVPLAVIWLTAAVSLAFTAFLVYAFRVRFSFATLCVIGLGVAPLVIYLAIFIPFHIYEAPPVPFWRHLYVMALFIAPNYLVCFVITCVALIVSGIFKATQETAAVLFVILVPVHALGLYFSYWLLTSPGSL
jgi:hypothetical protein